MATRHMSRHRMQLCAVTVFSFLVLHLVITSSSTQPSVDIIQFEEKYQTQASSELIPNEPGKTLPSIDEEIELNYLLNEQLSSEPSTKKIGTLQNSMRLIKEKIVSYQQKTANTNASPTSPKPTTGDDPSEDTSDSAEPQTIEGSSSFINIKPLINFTLNAFGLFNDINYEEPFDPNDSKRILHSMFQIWNPRASSWASRVSKEFKKRIRRPGGELGAVASLAHSNMTERTVTIEECGCERRIPVELERRGAYNDSTCSRASYERGAGQKVIGFSFYGNPNSTKSKERKYFQGIEDNLALLPKHYPGWTIRVYYDLEGSDPELRRLCDLACHNPSIDLCHVRDNPASGDISSIFAMIWRFFPTLDPNVDAFVSRDLDSRINGRERAAVEDWEAGNKHFHFMRDHPAHGIEILGSGWGVRLGPHHSAVRRMFRESFREAAHDPMFWAERKAYGPDQGFLKRFIWPWAKWTAVSHDSYFCRQFPRTSPFPTRRSNTTNNFVAAIVEAGDWLHQECPEQCRPREHRDWTMC